MYGKLFASTFTGSMVGAGTDVLAIWAYIIATTRPPGTVELNPVLVATAVGCDIKTVEKALKFLCAEDPRSRSKEHGGRRLIKSGEFMYDVPSWKRYNGMRNEDDRRAYFREKKRESRARAGGKKADVKLDVKECPTVSTGVHRGQPPSTHVDVDVEVHEDVEKESEKKNGRARRARAALPRAPSGAHLHLQACTWFAERFRELRGVEYKRQERDLAAAYRMLVKPRQAGVQPVTKDEWKLRAERMLQHRSAFHFEKASPAHLETDWNVFAVEIVPLTSSDRKQVELDKAWADVGEPEPVSRGTTP